MVAVQRLAIARNSQSVLGAILPNSIRNRAGARRTILSTPDIIGLQLIVIQVVLNEILGSIEHSIVSSSFYLIEESFDHLSTGRIRQSQNTRFILDVIRQRHVGFLPSHDRQEDIGLLLSLSGAGSIAVPIGTPMNSSLFTFSDVPLKLRIFLARVTTIASTNHDMRNASILDIVPIHSTLMLRDIDRIIENICHYDLHSFLVQKG